MNLCWFFTDFNNISKHKQLFHGLEPKIENLVHVTKSLEFFYDDSYIGPC